MSTTRKAARASQNPHSSPPIVIIGAGVAGLACAADLVQAGHSVKILEARDRIGGRTYTGTVSLDGSPIDLGARYDI